MRNTFKSSSSSNGRRQRRGLGLIWSTVVLVALCMLASLAVDFGRVQLVKGQLRAAADASALAAANLVLSDVPAARQAAIDTAHGNLADGKPVELIAADVVPVVWDEKQHTWALPAVGQKPNAVKVTAVRTAERGNAVDLMFARLLGPSKCDVHATAIAIARPVRYALVGLDYINMQGRSTNSYRTHDGTFSNYGSIASNGNITLSGSTLVNGDAYPGVGKQVIGANHVTGTTTPLTRALVYPQADAGTAATNNNNYAIQSYLTNGVLKLGNQREIEVAEGTYYLKGIDLQAGSKVTCTGKVTVYVTGSVTLSGHVEVYNQDPDNFRLIALGTGMKIDLNGGSELYADIYAPGAAITMAGNGDIYGSAVGKTVDTTGNAAFHYDLNLKGGIELVQ